jgi:probable F420-dependent oxidoreductase
MQLDIRLGGSLAEAGELARRAEALGFDGLWTSETGHDPFLPLALAVEHTSRLMLGTSIAVAFPRSPVTTAHLAWDLQHLSAGRFILGLGTQVKGHLQRRYGVPAEAPGPRLRDYVQALRAIWTAWRTGEPLDYHGPYYTHTLMPPFFRPAPLDLPHIPVHLAGVQHYLCRLAGELADGLHVHPFHSVRYLRDRVMPAVEDGLRAAGRMRSEISLVGSAMIVTGETSAELEAARNEARRQIAFYASTRNYAVILECHGWEEIGRELTRKSLRGDWDGMPALITEEMLDAFAVVGRPDEVSGLLRKRYEGLLDRLAAYLPFGPGAPALPHRAVLAAFPR